MENARQLLMDRGFPAEAVQVKIQERQVGIARDIIREAQNGYGAVVAGRQGMNPITRLVIGSIASKLIQSLTFVPLWLVGKPNLSNKVLVAMDASEGSMRAVEHIASMVGGSNLELTLFRVVRSLKSNVAEQDEKDVGQHDSKAESDEEAASHAIFEKAAQILEKAGITQDQITTKVVSGVATRSGSIIAQATSGGYGTIVLGRRGHSEVGDFYMGRVTNKVIQLAGKVAVWVVN
jgi:nucleotide-binding universal stress UspA family protein